MSQPRYGSNAGVGRREADIGLAGLPIAAAGGYGAYRASAPIRLLRRQAADARGEADGLLTAGRAAQARFEQSRDNLKRIQNGFRSAKDDPDARQRLSEEATRAKLARDKAERRARGARTDLGIARRTVKRKTAAAGRLLRGPRGIATAAGLGAAAAGLGMSGYGFTAAEVKRSRAFRERGQRQQQAFADRLRPAADTRTVAQMRPKGAPEGSRTVAQDPDTLKHAIQPSARQAKFGSWAASGKAGSDWQRDYDAKARQALHDADSGPLFRQVSR